MREGGNSSSVTLSDLWSRMMTQWKTARRSSFSWSYVTQCAETMRSSVSWFHMMTQCKTARRPSVSWPYMTQCAEAMRSSVSLFHMMKMCTTNDGLSVSDNLTLWQCNWNEILCLMIWYDVRMKQNEILCLIIWYDDTIQQQWDSLSHDLIWWQCSNNYTLCFPWSQMMTVQQKLHLVFTMISYDDSMSQACCSRLKRT